jgi:hypothetical protein
MGLKGYRLWDMGQLDSTCRAPPQRELLRHLLAVRLAEAVHDVALQVEI